MHEFFDPQPESESAHIQREKEERAKLAKEVVEAQAANLREPIRHLRNELVARGIPKNITVTEIGVKPAGPAPQVIGKKNAARINKRINIVRHSLKKPTANHNPHWTQSVRTVDRGWLVSESETHQGTHTITLLESGELILGGPIHIREGRTVAIDRGENAKLDLTTYPVHPLFETERGYAETYAAIPEAANNPANPFEYDSVESRVAINLDHLENDIRENGRKLLR